MKMGYVLLAIFCLTFTGIHITLARPLAPLCSDRLPYDFYKLPGSNTYYFIQYSENDYLEARANCYVYGADLMSILNEIENKFVYSFLKYTSYSRFHTNGVKTGGGDDVWRWQNTDLADNLVSYQNWHPDETFVTNADESHIVVVNDKNGGKWLHVGKTFKAPFVCQVRC